MGKQNSYSEIIYSTDSNFAKKVKADSYETVNCQNFRVHLDRRKAGKIVTIIRGYIGNPDELSVLGKLLKKKCGVGGTVKNNEILIQGNVRRQVISILTKLGHIAKPSGG